MVDPYPIQQLRQALAGPSFDAKLKAVIQLPDDAVGATKLLEGALDGCEMELRVVLLDALYRLHGDRRIGEELIAIMDSPFAAGDLGEELYMMSRIALNRIEGDDKDVLSAEEGVLMDFQAVPLPTDEATLTLVIHGTWARDGKWWRAGGDFHTYLKDRLGIETLYSGEQPFVWSGRNRDASRRDAAASLIEWVEAYGPERLEIYAHSHGANISMLATHEGLEIHKLVMLSPPVRSDYFAKWEQIEAAYNIQASFDPVVALARGGRWFDMPLVRELELSDSGHSASHSPEVWERNRVPRFLDLSPTRR